MSLMTCFAVSTLSEEPAIETGYFFLPQEPLASLVMPCGMLISTLSSFFDLLDNGTLWTDEVREVHWVHHDALLTEVIVLNRHEALLHHLSDGNLTLLDSVRLANKSDHAVSCVDPVDASLLLQHFQCCTFRPDDATDLLSGARNL